MSQYSKSISRHERGCIIFLIDQSGSMEDQFAGGSGSTKAEGVADAVNNLLNTINIRCTFDEDEPRHYFDIAVIGYGLNSISVSNALPIGGPDYFVSPADLQACASIEQKLDAHGEIHSVPVWIYPKAENGTPMCAALSEAERLLQEWVLQNPTSFPPVVINITDGYAGDGDPSMLVPSLQSLSTEDGNTLVFNCHISEITGQAVKFPSSPAGLPDDLLFNCSSILPDIMVDAAAQMSSLNIMPGARGLVFNASIVDLINLLKIGTAHTQRLR